MRRAGRERIEVQVSFVPLYPSNQHRLCRSFELHQIDPHPIPQLLRGDEALSRSRRASITHRDA